MSNEPRSEQSITDDEKTRFLIELMLSNGWSDEFNKTIPVVKIKFSSGNKYTENIYFADQMYREGLIQDADSKEFVYEISAKGKRFLDKQKGESK